MLTGLLRGAATRALGLGARTVDDVLNPVLRNARIKAGNILQQQLNPLSRQAEIRGMRNLGTKGRDTLKKSLADNSVRGAITGIATESVANPAIRNTVIVPAAGLTAAGALQVSDSVPSNSIEQRLNQVGPAIDNFIGGLNFPGQRTLEKFGREQESRGLGAALELATPFGFLAAPFIPNSGSKKQDPLSLRNKYGGSGDMDAGPGQVSFQSDRVAPAVLNGIPGIVDINPQTGKMLPGTWRRGDMDAGPGNVSEMNDPSQADYIAPPLAPQLPPAQYPELSPQERAYQAELARTQQMAAANPYFQQMNLYGQGQRAMQTPEDMAAVRDLGLAINRSMYGDVLTPKTPNPLMAGLTPPGPAQPVIAMDEEGRIGQLDTAAAGVQEFMRKYAEGMKKRKGEE